MYAFGTYSELAFSQSNIEAAANAFLSGVTGTTSVGTLTSTGKANQTPTGVQANSAADGATPGLGEGNTAVVGQQATVSANALADVEGAGNGSTTGVSATSAVGTLGFDAKANIVPFGVDAGEITVDVLFDADANITLDSASASADLTVTATEFADEDAQATIIPIGVQATMTASWNDNPDLTGGILAVQKVFAVTEVDRNRVVNIVPYQNYTVYIR